MHQFFPNIFCTLHLKYLIDNLNSKRVRLKVFHFLVNTSCMERYNCEHFSICSKSTAHDEEVRKLYEEMEYQIKKEKERILSEV